MTGVNEVAAEPKEAATGLGFNPRQLLFAVELPLAAPALISGLRVVVIQAIGLATVAALIGAGGLGVSCSRASANMRSTSCCSAPFRSSCLRSPPISASRCCSPPRGGGYDQLPIEAPVIELKDASKSFGGTPAVDGVSLRIEAGAFCVLSGRPAAANRRRCA